MNTGHLQWVLRIVCARIFPNRIVPACRRWLIVHSLRAKIFAYLSMDPSDTYQQCFDLHDDKSMEKFELCVVWATIPAKLKNLLDELTKWAKINLSSESFVSASTLKLPPQWINWINSIRQINNAVFNFLFNTIDMTKLHSNDLNVSRQKNLFVAQSLCVVQ